jgi:outer membrane protein TolC
VIHRFPVLFSGRGWFAGILLAVWFAAGLASVSPAEEPIPSRPTPLRSLRTLPPPTTPAAGASTQPTAAPPPDEAKQAPQPAIVPDAGQSDAMPIDLATALRLARAANPTINLARERVLEAYARLDQANVLWLPNLRAGPSYLRHDGQIQNSAGVVFGTSKSSLFAGGGAEMTFQVSDALFAPLAARRLAQAQAAQAEGISQQIQLDVVSAYLDLLRVHGQLAVNDDITRRAKETARFSQLVEEAGLSKSTGDLPRARTEVALRQREHIDLEADAAVASARLAQLLLLRPEVDLRPADPAVVPLTLVPIQAPIDELIATGLLNRPELAESRELVAAAIARWRQARVSLLVPRVDVAYFGGEFGGGMNERVGQFSGRSDGLAQATWELHNFLAGDLAVIRERRAQINEANVHVVEVEAQVSAEVAAAAKVARKRWQSLKDAEKAVVESLEAWRRLEAASRELLTGNKSVDTLEPLIAVQTLAQARAQYLAEVIEYNRAQFRLYTAMGQPAADALPKATMETLKVPALPIPDKDMPRPK